MPAHLPPDSARPRRPARRRLRHSHLRHRDHLRSSAAARARVVARLLAASQALAADPDAAALLLDGALSQMLALAASSAGRPIASGRAALEALDAQSPAIAARVRLALHAHNPEARLAHCWALLGLLTPTAAPPTASVVACDACDACVAQPTRHAAQLPAQRKDS